MEVAMSDVRFYKKRILLFAALFACGGFALSLLLLAGAASGAALQGLSWACAGACISMTIADIVHGHRFGSAHVETFGLALACLLIEVVLVIALGVLVLAVLFYALTDFAFDW